MASIIQSAHSPCLRQLPARHTTTASKLMRHASFHGCRRPCISISSALARLGGPVRAKAAVSAADSPVTSGLENGSGNSSSDKVLLEVRGLTAVIAETRQKILKGVNLIIREGEFFTYVSKKLELVNMDLDFLNRNVNEGFSGGEKKRNEILQLAVLGADLAILDEIDSGLDVDALKIVAQAVNKLLNPTNSVLMITHYRRLLEFIKPGFVHVMEDGRIIKTGDITIADILEKGGYQALASP